MVHRSFLTFTLAMENVININIGGYHQGDKWVSVSTARLWSSTLAATRWLLSAPKPQQEMIYSGALLISVNSLAIVLEGFVGDMIFARLDCGTDSQPDDVRRLKTASWDPKRKFYNKHFEKSFEDYSSWPAMDILFILRNYLLHGLSYKEKTVADNITGTERSNISSDNDNYQKAREFFIAKKLLADTTQMSNRETLWKIEIVAFLFAEVTLFMRLLLNDNRENKFDAIRWELDLALKV